MIVEATPGRAAERRVGAPHRGPARCATCAGRSADLERQAAELGERLPARRGEDGGAGARPRRAGAGAPAERGGGDARLSRATATRVGPRRVARRSPPAELFARFYGRKNGVAAGTRARASSSATSTRRRASEAAAPGDRGLHLLQGEARARPVGARPLRDHGRDGRGQVARSSTRSSSPSTARSRGSRKEYRQLISHGAERLTVHLEFEVGDADLPHRPHRAGQRGHRPDPPRVAQRQGLGAAGRPLARGRGAGAADRRPRLRRLHALGGPAPGPVRRVPEGPARRAPEDPGRAPEPPGLRADAHAGQPPGDGRAAARPSSSPAARRRLRGRDPGEPRGAPGPRFTGRRRSGAASGPRQEALRRGLEVAGRVRVARRDRDASSTDRATEEARTKAAQETLRAAGEKHDALERECEAPRGGPGERFGSTPTGTPRSSRRVRGRSSSPTSRAGASASQKAQAEKQAALEPRRRALQAAEEARACPREGGGAGPERAGGRPRRAGGAPAAALRPRAPPAPEGRASPARSARRR